jgi:hypothetical protein
MTVAQLIQLLQTLPADQVVRIQHPYLDETAALDEVFLVGPAGNIPVLGATFR